MAYIDCAEQLAIAPTEIAFERNYRIGILYIQQQIQIMKRRKQINLFGPSRHPDPRSRAGKKSRSSSLLGISLGSAIAGLGMVALSGNAHATEFWWNGLNGGSMSGLNWSTTAPGGDSVLLDGNADAVFSINSGAINQNADLGSVVSISSLRVNDPTSVTISGITPLTITGTALFSGINIETGAGPTTIATDLNLGLLAQTVTVNNEDGLLVSGDMVGTNGLIKNGTGKLTLTGTNTYIGATNVLDGTLQVGNGVTAGASISLASLITVGADGILTVNLANNESFTNSIINNGQIQWIATGTNTQTVGSVFSGTGDMLITATGTTILSGVNTFTGGTTIGTTGLFDNTGEVRVDNSSAFGSGPLTIHSGTVDTAGLLPVDINVGDYVQTGGEIRIRMQGPEGAAHTQYNVDGDITLSGGTVYVYDTSGTYVPAGGDVQTIIQATGIRTGVFASNSPDSLFYNAALDQNVSYAEGETLLYPTITYDPDAVMVSWIQDSFASPVGLTRNQNSLGNALDNGAAPAAVTDFLNTQDVALLPGFYDLIAPDELTALYQMGFAASEIQNKNIQRHLERVRRGSPSETQYMETVTDSKGGMVQQQATRMSDANRWSVFLEGTDGSASVDGDTNASGYDFDTRGATLGADLRVSDRLIVGILGAYTESDASLVNGGSIADEAFKGAIYATMYSDAFYVDALLGAGRHSYEFSRSGLLGIATGETDAWQIDAMVNTGYDIKAGNWTYGPTASLAYTRITIDEFSEIGSLSPLSYDSQHQDSLRSELGAKLAYTAEFGSMKITPQVRVGWQHEFMDSTQSIDSGFVGGPGGSFSTNGPSMDENRFVMGAGLTVQVTPNFSIYGSYDGHIGSSDYDSNQVTAGIKFDF